MTLTQITEKGIKDGEIINADINASAAIAKSKLASLDIVNADVNASAAIAGSKIDPTFTSTVNVTNNLPEIFLTDSNSNNARARLNANGGGLLLGADNDNAAADSVISFAVDGSEKSRIDSSGRLLIGHDAAVFSSAAKFQLSGDGNHYLQVSRFTADANANRLRFHKSRSATVGTASTTSSGDSLGIVDFYGVDASNNSRLAASINAEMDGSSSTNTMPGRLTFKTTPTTFSAALERMRIDSSGRLLIGHSTGNGYPQLSISGNTAGASGAGMLFLRRGLDRATIGSNVGADLGEVDFGDLDGNIYASIQGKTDAATGSNDYPGRLVFATTTDNTASLSERMRINSDGALMVGTTVSRTAEFSHPDGVSIRGDVKGQYQSTVTDSMNMLLNRDGTDGQILGFRKDGSDIGNIGVSGSNIYFQFGSTGTDAHRLDDYEEGTWTPTFPNNGTGNQALGTYLAEYVKVGRFVYAFMYANITGAPQNSATTWVIGGLPFATNYSSLYHHGTGNVTYVGGNSYSQWRPLVTINTSVYFHRTDGNNAVLQNSDVANEGMAYWIMGLNYMTSS